MYLRDHQLLNGMHALRLSFSIVQFVRAHVWYIVAARCEPLGSEVIERADQAPAAVEAAPAPETPAPTAVETSTPEHAQPPAPVTGLEGLQHLQALKTLEGLKALHSWPLGMAALKNMQFGFKNWFNMGVRVEVSSCCRVWPLSSGCNAPPCSSRVGRSPSRCS